MAWWNCDSATTELQPPGGVVLTPLVLTEIRDTTRRREHGYGYGQGHGQGHISTEEGVNKVNSDAELDGVVKESGYASPLAATKILETEEKQNP